MTNVIACVLLALVVLTNAQEFSRHLNADHVHDHDYPRESRSSKREDRDGSKLEKLNLPKGPLGHIADSQSLRMNALESELEVLSREVENIQSEDLDVKGALNFLRILKGNGCGKKQYQCLEAANEVPECISHHAVCDGVKDCRNGNDEKADRCRNLTPVGSSWGGDLQWIGCAAHRSKRVYVVITTAVPHKFMKSYLQVSATLVFSWVEKGKTFSNTEQANGHYCYGSQALKLRATTGAHVGADLKCTFTDDVHCHGELFKASTGTICSRVILNRQ